MIRIPWFKVDDHFWSHPKTADLSDGATALWLRAGSWSAGHLTDGRVPVSMLRMFRARRRSADELISVGLWSIDGDAFVFHSWHEYQPSKAQVESKREATRNRVNAWRERTGNGVTNASHDEDGNAAPDPTRPDPTRPSISNEIENSLSPDESDDRGDLIPDDWRPNQGHIDKANSLHLNVQHEYQKFRARAEQTQRRLKNWNTGFTNWLRKAAEFNQQRQGAAPAQPRKQSKAAQNAAEYRRIFGGADEHAGSIPAIGPGLSS
ncbi:hypothetical protein ACTJJ4_11715 [Microbacterium sp. 22195]|uniref:hypothetical protein n=1 Tax=Microbacterium sp. 22195 TaxID=3453891 RepID=UPI003F849A3D